MARKQFLSFLLIFSLLISYASALAEADARLRAAHAPG